MFKGDRNFVVGLFVTVAIAAFIFFVIWLTGRSGNEELTRYSLLYERDVTGLAVGGPVKYMGVNVGSVVRMTLEREEGIAVRVDIDVLANTPVDSGTYATLAMQGITGVAVVNLASEPGSHAPLATQAGREYPVIPVRDVGFAALMSSMPKIVTRLDDLLAQAAELMGEENRALVTGTLANLEQVSGALAENRESLAAIPQQISEMLSEVQATVGQLQQLLNDSSPDVSSAISKLEQSAQNLSQLTGRLDTLVQQHEDDIGHFMNDGLAQAPALINDARQAMRELEKLLQELQDNPSQLIHRSEDNTVEIDP